MYIGVDYYPEHWSKDRWETDAKMMQAAGFNVVRLAEFSWVFLEPQEGLFEFGWLDEALEMLAKHGIQAILGTPTAVMPAWMAHRYPETMAMQKDGERIAWGVRKNNCFSSGAYRLFSERITRAMAEHFRATPNVIGWQTDNEFGNPTCFCDTCRKDFQDWLRRKYQSLSELNRAWGNHFWGQLFSAWDEIPIPQDAKSYNPSACLDWQRFYSYQNVRFQHDQVAILRSVCPQHFVTHNFMGLFHELDYYDLAKELDFVSWDNYPVGGKPGIPYAAAQAADIMRGLKKQNFWIMEQTAGAPGWGGYGRNPRPGEIEKVAFQQLAHGADHIIWFRWRTCTAGREQYWHGLVGHDGKGLRRYQEATTAASHFQAVSSAIEGTSVQSKVAILYDYENIWAVRIQPGYLGNSYHAAMERIYNALFRAGINVDFIRSTDDYSQYRVIFAPDLFILPDSVAGALNQFVAQGGVLFADSRLGVKDETNLAHERTLPGLLSEALGISIEEYESLGFDWAPDQAFSYPLKGSGAFHGEFTAQQTAEWVIPHTAEALVVYDAWHMNAYAALTRNAHGKGWGYFLGTVVAEQNFYDTLVKEILNRAELAIDLELPLGVEASRRSGLGKDVLFLINHTEAEQKVSLPQRAYDLIAKVEIEGELTLERYTVKVLRM